LNEWRIEACIRGDAGWKNIGGKSEEKTEEIGGKRL